MKGICGHLPQEGDGWLPCRRRLRLQGSVDGLTEAVHSQTKPRPQMLRISVVGGNAPLVPLPMGENHAVFLGIQRERSAQLGKERDCGLIRPCHGGLGSSGVLVYKMGTCSVVQGGRFAHLYPDMGVVGRPTGVPSLAGPGKGLIDDAGVGIDEAVDAGFDAWLVPRPHKGSGRGLRTAHRMEHQPLDGKRSSSTIAVVVGQVGFLNGKRHEIASSLRMGHCPLYFLGGEGGIAPFRAREPLAFQHFLEC